MLAEALQGLPDGIRKLNEYLWLLTFQGKCGGGGKKCIPEGNSKEKACKCLLTAL